MEPGNRDNIYTIRDVTEDKSITVQGKDSVHLIGLGQDGGIKAVSTKECSAPGLCVSLVQLTICKNGGMILAPINRDILCSINGDNLTSEINLLSGVPIEVADRTIKIYNGKAPNSSLRRKLPTTPGTAVNFNPPPKPRRGAEDEEINDDTEQNGKESPNSPPPPVVDPSILSNIESNGQLADLAASFLTKQINQYTDSKLSAVITDQIFALLQEVVAYQRGIIVTYVSEISRTLEEMPEAERDRPMHRPAVKLLVELLRQIMDPLSHVVLDLQLLRTFSHFPQNLDVMVQCQATPAVLGCMAVYLDVTEIQQYGLDILAKIATYKPKIEEKLPLRETALEMILRAMTHHCKNMRIVQPGCRTLTNLTGTLQDILDNLLNTEYHSSPDIEEAIEKYELLLRHIFELSIPVVQNTMEEFPNSLDIKTEGRMFLFSYSKMTQFLQKKKLRAEAICGISAIETNVSEALTTPGTFRKLPDNNEPPSILKKAQFYPPSSSPDRKVHFADDDVPPDSLSSSDTESSEFDLTSSLENGPLLVVKETKILSKEDAEALRRGEPKTQFLCSIESDSGKGSSNESERQPISDGPEDKVQNSADPSSSPVIGDHKNSTVSPVEGEQNDLKSRESESSSVSGVQNESNDEQKKCENLNGEDMDLVNKVDTESLIDFVFVEDENVEVDTLKPSSVDDNDSSIHSQTDDNDYKNSTVPLCDDSRSLDDEKIVNNENQNQLESSDESYFQMGEKQSEPVKSEEFDSKTSLDPPQTVFNGSLESDENSGSRDPIDGTECHTGKPSLSRRASYTISDVAIFTKIIRLKVSQYVSSLVFGGDDAVALSGIDQPVGTLLSDAGAPAELVKYVAAQYAEEKTLMDIDTSYLISVIDAIRYRSLFHDLLQKSVMEVVNCMFGCYSLETLSIAVVCLLSVFRDDKLLSLLAEKNYLKEVSGSMFKLSSMLQKDIPEIQELSQLVFQIKPIE